MKSAESGKYAVNTPGEATTVPAILTGDKERAGAIVRHSKQE